MTEIQKKDLEKHIGKEVVVKDGSREQVIVVHGIRGGWLSAFSKTHSSFLSILLSARDGENPTKYFLK